ncbi:formate/nitrite transporter family protein [Actinomyces minihominis]|uniref:formate/nitrite transporter family protein n=1 Tax=Actinomyces minihominis TaxID=2002838 RepID=UPI000C078C84|nr:formate/nitrite transporter family protein [Actinomyces minihominis]
MLTLSENLDLQATTAVAKVASLRKPGRLFVSGMMAGIYMGIGVILMVSTAGPLLAAGDGFGKLVSGLVFGAALTLTVFAGADLATSAMMILPLGVLMRTTRLGQSAAALGFIVLANAVGALFFGALIVASGVLVSNQAAGTMLSDMLASKAAESPLELFTRGVLCNVLVCLAIWMSSRVRSDGTKIALIFVAITAFIASGYEHVVANMTTYTIGILTGDPNGTLALYGYNFLWVGLGNLVGGAVVVAFAYWVIGGRPRLEILIEEPTSKSATVK